MTTTDPLDALTIAEIDAGSRLLRADLVGAITNGTALRWPALAVTAYLHARRTDPAAQLATYRAMTAAELTAELGMSAGDDEDETELTGDGTGEPLPPIPDDNDGSNPLPEVEGPPIPVPTLEDPGAELPAKPSKSSTKSSSKAEAEVLASPTARGRA